MPQQSSGWGWRHWDQEEFGRGALSPSDFPWGRGNFNTIPSEGGVSGQLQPSRISDTRGQYRRQPSPVLTGRVPAGAVQQAPEKNPVRKGGVEILRECSHSQSGPRGLCEEILPIWPGRPRPAKYLFSPHRYYSAIPFVPLVRLPLSGSASGSY